MKKILCLLCLSVSFHLFAQKAHLVLPVAHVATVNQVLFSKDDKLLITADNKGYIKIWDVATQRLYNTFELQQLKNIKLSNDGEYLYVVDGKGLYYILLSRMAFSPSFVECPKGCTFLNYCPTDDGGGYIFGKEAGKPVTWILQPGFKVEKLATNDISSFCLGYTADIATLKNNNSVEMADATTSVVKQRFAIPASMVNKDKLSMLESGVTYSQKNGTTIIWNGQFLIGYDSKSPSGRMLLHGNNGLNERGLFTLSNSGKYFATYEKSPVLYNINGQKIATFGNAVFHTLKHFATSPSNNEFSINAFSNPKTKYIKISDEILKVATIKNAGEDYTGTESRFINNGKALIANDNTTFDLYDLTKPVLQKKLIFKDDIANQNDKKIFSNDGTLLAINKSVDGTFSSAKENKIKIINTINKQVIYEHLFAQKMRLQAISPDNQFVFFSTELNTKYGGPKENTTCINITNGKIIWSQDYYAPNFVFKADGTSILATISNKIVSINAADGSITDDWAIDYNYGEFNPSAFSANGDFFINDPGSISIYDVKNKSNIGKVASRSYSKGLKFLKGNRYAISFSGNDDFIHFYDIEKKTEIAKMVLYEDTDDWAVFTADGRFDASEAALKTMYYVKGNEFIALEALSEKFYTPRLLQSLLAGADIEPVPLVIDDIKAAPKVKITFDNKQRNLTVEDDMATYNTDKQTVELQVQADCPLDAVTEIRLFQNGKLVSTTRNLTVADDTKGEKTMLKTFSVLLVDGENRFKAVAFNSQRTESKPDEIAINYKGLQIPNANNKAELYLFVVGLNNYKNPKYNLNYALADATSIADAISNGSQNLFSKVNTTFLKDADADKKGIMAAFEKIQATAKPQDLFIFYYAGHGVINDKKEFFLVPYDVTQLYGDDDALAQKGLSAEVLKEMSKNIKAQKQLFILDACQSAGALVTIASSRGAAEEKAISQLARSTGTHWLTASGSEQYATEFAALGHGLFTYTLLQGLKGGAANTAKQITVNALKAYLETQVPELSEKYKGKPQYPASYGYGNDFPIEILK